TAYRLSVFPPPTVSFARRMVREIDPTLARELTVAGRLPIFRWLREYRRSWLRDDAIAGLTLAAYAIPVSLAYASLAAVPPQMGLYCYLVGGLGYALLGSLRHLAVVTASGILLLL